MKPLRILIADDHEMVRQGQRVLLENQRGWEVCGEAVTGREAVAKARELKPDVIILDITMPDLNGLDATRQIRAEAPDAEVLILTMHDSDQLAREVMAVGAHGYVLKSDAGAALVAAVKALAEHKPFFTSRVSGFAWNASTNGRRPGGEAPADRPQLTPREREIVQLLAEGSSNKQVAGALQISVKTAETHRTNIMRKLQIHSMSELVRYAIRNKMVEP